MRCLLLLLVSLLAAAPAEAQRVMNYGKAPAAPNRNTDWQPWGVEQQLGKQVPLDLVFKDEHDQEITLGSCVGGKPTILVLSFYRCQNNCPLVLHGVFECVKKIEGDIGDQFNIVAVSFDPKDGHAVAYDKKSYYVGDYGRPKADKGVHFLTGQQPAIDELCQSVGFRYEFNKEKKQYEHPSCITILTPHGKIAQYFSGIDFDAKEVHAALEKAGGEKIGKEIEPSDFVKFFCYELDPETGKYSLSVMKALRIVFGTLLLVLSVWLFRVWRRPPNVAQPAQPVAAP
jgi:protein SCO1/2